MGIFAKYPYTDFSNLNLDWILSRIRFIEGKLDEYLENSVITFADPITWDITEQYTALTCVVDSDGTAYLSKQPVPAGVDISNTNYWMPIFNYDDNMNKLRESITTRATATGTTPKALQAGDLIWYEGELYTVNTDLPAGSLIIPGTNADKITFEAWVNLYKNYVDGELITINGNISDINADIVTINGELSAIESTVNRTFDTVAAMKAYDLQDGDRVYVFGYYAVNDGGAAYYKIYDTPPIVPYITLDNGLYAKIQAVDFISPKMFGAYGNGISDDYLPVSTAISYAKDNNITLRFTGVEKGYYISSGVQIDVPMNIIMDSPIWYHDTGAALTITGTYEVFGNIKIVNGYNGNELFDAPNGSTGLLIYNSDNCMLNIDIIAGYDQGMRIEGNNDGCCYHVFNVSTIRRCKTGIKMLAIGTGWANENKFYGGCIWVGSSDPFKSSSVGIDLEGNSNNRADGNVFYSPCCEGLYCGVNAKYAVCNYVYDMRTEGTNYAFRGAEDVYLNEIHVSFGTTTAATQLSGNLVEGHLAIPSKIMKYKIYDSGELTNRTVFANASQTYFGSSKICFLDTTSAVFSPTKNLTGVSFNGTGISIDSTRIVGIRVNARTAKRFRIKQYDPFNNGFCRPVVAAIDANSNYLPTGVTQVEPAPIWTLTTVGSAQVFQLGNNSDDVYVTVTGACTDVFIGFMPGSTGHTLREFEIWADEPTTALDSVTEGLNSVPTAASYSGCICPCSTYVATDTFYGWRSLGGGSFVQI